MDQEAYRRGLALFNQGEFFDAHEVLEDVWRASQGKSRRFLQALIQIAVGLHHHSTGNLVGARSLLARGLAKLEDYPAEYGGLDVAGLRRDVAAWRDALAQRLPPPSAPRCEPPDGRIPLPLPRAAKSETRPQRAIQAIPLLDLGRQYAHIEKEILAAVERVCASQRYILGGEVEAFESEVAQFTGAAHAVACASGTDALWLALLAVGVQPGQQVLTTPFSFFATASAIVRAGARPVFVDIDPRTFNLDPVLVEGKLWRAGQFSALMPVHLYGQCTGMDPLLRLSREHRLPLIEDAAQAFGAAWRGQRAGSLGTVAGFSFYPSKNLGAFGDGGLVTAREEETAERLRRLRNHGSRQRYHHEEIGWNSRLDELQAAILRVKLKHVEEWNARRRERASEYARLFAAAGLVENGETPTPQAPVRLPGSEAPAHHVYHQYVIRAQRRDDLRRFLSERGIGTEVYYPVPLHLQKALMWLGYRQGDFPQAERAAAEVLALPIFPELTADEQRRVVETISEFYS